MKNTFFKRSISLIIVVTFLCTTVVPPSLAQSVLNLPAPGAFVGLSPSYTPAIINGMTIHPENPLKFDFIVDIGDDKLSGKALEEESQKLINYFMASLTVPEKDMWVNLSPYEADQMIAEGLGNTLLGRDMLAQDYILKQLTASLMLPDGELGKEFWKRVYEKAQAKFGTTDIPVDTFHKIWIIPEKAVVYVKGNTVFVADSHLKVLLEEDYLALSHMSQDTSHMQYKESCDMRHVTCDHEKEISTEIMKEVLIPEIEREVNEGKNFATLRQIYNSLILATWYKKNLKESVLGKVYADQNKINGVDLDDKDIKNKIYNQYVEAFKKGVYDEIKEEYDAVSQEIIPRRYFSGGESFDAITETALDERPGTVPSGTRLAERVARASPQAQVSLEVRLGGNIKPELRDTTQEDMRFILDEATKRLEPAQVQKINNAIELALEIHEGQTRNDGIRSYSVHVVGVARNLIEKLKVFDLIEDKARASDLVAASLLHDTVEDFHEGKYGKKLVGRMSRENARALIEERIRDEVGADVLAVVLEVTSTDLTDSWENEGAFIEGIAQKSLWAQLLKIANWMYNQSDLMTVPNRSWTRKALDSTVEPILNFLRESVLPDHIKELLLRHMLAEGERNNDYNRQIPGAENVVTLSEELREKITAEIFLMTINQKERDFSVGDDTKALTAADIEQVNRLYLARHIRADRFRGILQRTAEGHSTNDNAVKALARKYLEEDDTRTGGILAMARGEVFEGIQARLRQFEQIGISRFSEEERRFAVAAADYGRRMKESGLPKRLDATNDIDEADEMLAVHRRQPLWEGGPSVMSVAFSPEFGGPTTGNSTVLKSIMTAAVARVSQSAAMIADVGLTAGILNKYATDAQKEFYLRKLAAGEILIAYGLSEPGSGSDAANMNTTAKWDETSQRWILNGSKHFITIGEKADYAIVFAVDITNGPVPREQKSKNINAFLVPLKGQDGTKGVSVNHQDTMAGDKGTGTSEIFFSDVELAEDTLLGGEELRNKGFTIAMQALDSGRLTVTAMSVGSLDRTLSETAQYREEIAQTITSEHFQSLDDFMMDAMADELQSRLFLFEAARMRDRGETHTLESALAKFFSSEAAVRNAAQAAGLIGVDYLEPGHDFERNLRDSKVLTIFEGTSQIMRLLIKRLVFNQGLAFDEAMRKEAAKMPEVLREALNKLADVYQQTEDLYLKGRIERRVIDLFVQGRALLLLEKAATEEEGLARQLYDHATKRAGRLAQDYLGQVKNFGSVISAPHVEVPAMWGDFKNGIQAAAQSQTVAEFAQAAEGAIGGSVNPDFQELGFNDVVRDLVLRTVASENTPLALRLLSQEKAIGVLAQFGFDKHKAILDELMSGQKTADLFPLVASAHNWEIIKTADGYAIQGLNQVPVPDVIDYHFVIDMLPGKGLTVFIVSAQNPQPILVGEEGKGAEVLEAFQRVWNSGMKAISQALATKLIDAGRTYATEVRQAFGQYIINFPEVREMVEESENDLNTMTDQDATQKLVAIAERMVQLHGGVGYDKETGIPQMWLLAHTLNALTRTQEILRASIVEQSRLTGQEYWDASAKRLPVIQSVFEGPGRSDFYNFIDHVRLIGGANNIDVDTARRAYLKTNGGFESGYVDEDGRLIRANGPTMKKLIAAGKARQVFGEEFKKALIAKIAEEYQEGLDGAHAKDKKEIQRHLANLLEVCLVISRMVSQEENISEDDRSFLDIARAYLQQTNSLPYVSTEGITDLGKLVSQVIDPNQIFGPKQSMLTPGAAHTLNIFKRILNKFNYRKAVEFSNAEELRAAWQASKAAGEVFIIDDSRPEPIDRSVSEAINEISREEDGAAYWVRFTDLSTLPGMTSLQIGVFFTHNTAIRSKFLEFVQNADYTNLNVLTQNILKKLWGDSIKLRGESNFTKDTPIETNDTSVLNVLAARHLKPSPTLGDGPRYAKDGALRLDVGASTYPISERLKQGMLSAFGKDPEELAAILRGHTVTYLQRSRGLNYSPDEIILGMGVKPLLTDAMTAIVAQARAEGRGVTVTTPVPYWGSYEMISQLAGATFVEGKTTKENNYLITVKELEEAFAISGNDQKVLVLSSPGNPAGQMYTREQLVAIGKWALANNVYILSDEIYGLLTNGTIDHVSMAALSDELGENADGRTLRDMTVVFTGLSKEAAAPGIRMGFLSVSKESGLIDLINQNRSGDPDILALGGAIGMLEDYDAFAEYVDGHRAFILQHIKPIQEFLDRKEHEFEVIESGGAIYVQFRVDNKWYGKIWTAPDGTQTTITADNLFGPDGVFYKATTIGHVAGAGFAQPGFMRFAIATNQTAEAAERLYKFDASLKDAPTAPSSSATEQEIDFDLNVRRIGPVTTPADDFEIKVTPRESKGGGDLDFDLRLKRIKPSAIDTDFEIKLTPREPKTDEINFDLNLRRITPPSADDDFDITVTRREKNGEGEADFDLHLKRREAPDLDFEIKVRRLTPRGSATAEGIKNWINVFGEMQILRGKTREALDKDLERYQEYARFLIENLGASEDPSQMEEALDVVRYGYGEGAKVGNRPIFLSRLDPISWFINFVSSGHTNPVNEFMESVKRDGQSAIGRHANLLKQRAKFKTIFSTLDNDQTMEILTGSESNAARVLDNVSAVLKNDDEAREVTAYYEQFMERYGQKSAAAPGTQGIVDIAGSSLPTRVKNVLAGMGITEWRQLAEIREKDILKERNAGTVTVEEIKEGMARRGISFKRGYSLFIPDSELSTRAKNVLAGMGITKWEQLAETREEDIFKERNAGIVTVEEIKEGMAQRGISFTGNPFIADSELSTRAKTVLVAMGITEWEQLAETREEDLRKERKAGIGTVEEIKEGMAQRGISFKRNLLIADSEISTRVKNVLAGMGITKWEQLAQTREGDLRKEPKVGIRAMAEIKEGMAQRGIKFKEDSPGSAMLSTPGGIDFNADNLHLEEQGQKIQFEVPQELEGLNPNNVNSVTPVIINIVPIANFPLLLGLIEEPAEPALTKL